MRSKELLAIVFSDLHLSDWSKYSTRLDTAIDIWKRLAKKASKNKVPLIHCGDILHKPESITIELSFIMQNILHYIDTLPNFEMWSISGNHSINSLSKIGEKPKSWDLLFSKYSSNWNVLDYQRLVKGNVCFYGVPYIDNNSGLSQYLKGLKLDKSKKNILLLHTSYPGAKDTDNRPISSENISVNDLSKFDLVLCGHIHKPQRLGKKVYMIGSPYQQRRSDKDCNLGYWELYKDLSLKFVPLKDYPKYIDVDSEDKIKEDGNYYTLVTPQVKNVPIKHKINKSLSKKKLAHRYMITRGIDDSKKEDLLIRILKKSE